MEQAFAAIISFWLSGNDLLSLFISSLLKNVVVFISLHPLNLNHETRQLEEVVLIKHLVLLNDSVTLVTLENLVENLFDQRVVAIVKQIDQISFQDFDQLPVV